MSIHGLPPSYGASAAAAAAAAQPHPRGITPIRRNSGEHLCPEIVLCQFLLSARDIGAKVPSETVLAKLIQKLYGYADRGEIVPADLPQRLRGELDFLLDRHTALHEQTDPVDGLVLILERYGAPIETINQEKHTSLCFAITPGKNNFIPLLNKHFPREQLTVAPNRLIITSQQTCHQNGKIAGNISNVPLRFSLHPDHVLGGGKHQYELTGCIYHSGEDNNGHFTYLKKQEEQWYLINDDRVALVPDPHRFFAQGYVFHYQKVDTHLDRMAPMGPPPARTCQEQAARIALLAYWCLGKVVGMTYRGIRYSIALITKAKKDS